ncbi:MULTISPECIES: hypothetical protein [unclassified Burkholderia]|uniref:hypothetical protein n=1 Tax=unclassified Burkholderia TaxID=2613784 RepID=UPI002AB3111B|nr:MULTISPECIES: hypothetical protein [unclassified Burkholderia]
MTFRVYHLSDTRDELARQLSHNNTVLDAQRDADKARALYLAPAQDCEYRLVAELDARDLEDVFERTNTIEREWWNNPGVDPKFSGSGCRSTSVGDIIVDERGVAHLCSPSGWTDLGQTDHHGEAVEHGRRVVVDEESLNEPEVDSELDHPSPRV